MTQWGHLRKEFSAAPGQREKERENKRNKREGEKEWEREKKSKSSRGREIVKEQGTQKKDGVQGRETKPGERYEEQVLFLECSIKTVPHDVDVYL